MRQHGITGSRARLRPWLGLFTGAVMLVIGVIVALSLGPGPRLGSSDVDLSAPQAIAPAAPNAMG